MQETLLAALRAAAAYRREADERTWLIGILKHKIIDHLRAAARSSPIQPADAAELSSEYKPSGLWKTGPRKWHGQPQQWLTQADFVRVLDECLAELPPLHAAVFILREIDGLAGEEICKLLELSPTNLWTILHRARARLRRALEVRWFGREE